MTHRKFSSVTMWSMIHFLTSRHRVINASSQNVLLALSNDKRRIVTSAAFVTAPDLPSSPAISCWTDRRKALCDVGSSHGSSLFERSTSAATTNRKNTRSISTSRKLNCSNDTYGRILELEAETVEDMEEIGAVLGICSQKGDVILLDGDIGAGKTCFSRGFVRAKTGHMDLRVTSPTYLLSNTYPIDNDSILIHHMDLYRLSEGKEDKLSPLNLDYVMKECISLIEWPSRLGSLTPKERLEITISIDSDAINIGDEQENTRILLLKPFGERWVQRLHQIQDYGYLDDLVVEYEGDHED